MKSLSFLLILVVAAVIIGLLVLKRRGLLQAGSGAWPFYVRKPLSQPEQVLHHRLVRALPEHIVLAQVQVSRVLGVKKGANFHEWNNRINRLSYDFVVCGKDASVIAAIELDDRSHEAPGRARTDDKKNKATADAGLRLLRWQARALPSEEMIRAELLAPPPAPPAASTAASPAVAEASIDGAQAQQRPRPPRASSKSSSLR